MNGHSVHNDSFHRLPNIEFNAYSESDSSIHPKTNGRAHKRPTSNGHTNGNSLSSSLLDHSSEEEPVQTNGNGYSHDEPQPLVSQFQDILRGLPSQIWTSSKTLFKALWTAQRLVSAYVWADTKRSKKGFLIGLFTVFLVVCILATLYNSTTKSPIIFFRLAEKNVGEIDLLLTPGASLSPDSDVSIQTFPILNQSLFDHVMPAYSSIEGSAGRWLLFAKILPLDNTTTNETNHIASALTLGVDSIREKEIGLGRAWPYPPLIGHSCYLSRTIVRQIGYEVDNAVGKLIIFRVDLFDMLQQLGLYSSGEDDLQNIERLIGILLPNLPSGFWQQNVSIPLPFPPFILNVTNEQLLNLTVPFLLEQSVADINLIINGVIDSPEGKWPEAYGSVIMLESQLAISLFQDMFYSLLNVSISSITLPIFNQSIPINPPLSLESLLELLDPNSQQNVSQLLNNSVNFVKNLNANDASLITIVEYSDRIYAYQQNLNSLNTHIQGFTNDVASAIGLRYPASFEIPLVTALTTSIYGRYFMENILNSVVALLVLLGVMLIYSLLLQDVDSKTYEYGMLRALGMRHRTLIQLLMTKSFLFAIPGVGIGLLIAFLINIPIANQIADYATIPPSFVMFASAILIATLIGLIMPMVANIVPISRALSRTLRDSLDVYHHVISDVNVRMIRLADMGLDLWQSCLAVLMVFVGFITYYVIPYSFLFGNIPLFLSILNGILLGMLLGLCIIASILQPYLERLILRIMLFFHHRHLHGIVRKNLSGHRGRNAKTAQMFTICTAFLVFAGVMFSLLGNSLIDNLKLVFAADISVQIFGNRNFDEALNEADMSAYLDANIARRLLGDLNAVVVGYSFLTFPLNYVPGVNDLLFSSLPQFRRVRNLAYGVSENFLDVTYNEYYLPTAISRSSVPIPNANGYPDAIKMMYLDAGKDVLPLESDGIRIPKPIGSGFTYTKLNQYFNETQLQVDVATRYTDYVDVIIGEALRPSASITIETPLSLFLPGHFSSITSLCKARAMVRKMPGFFYSSYGEAAPISAVLLPQNQYLKLLDSVIYPTSPYYNVPSPKQRLFIRVTDSSTRDQREDVINGLRTFFKTDATIVIDTRTYVETTLETVSLLDLFFEVIGVLAMIMCFFILWLSFTANVRENSWEFGVLRAIGVNSSQVVLIYVYEAIALVIAAFTLGTIIGILIASSLTAQFNLFLEMPFHLTFPHMLFWALFILSLLVSIVGSVLPARSFLNSTISSVLRGQ